MRQMIVTLALLVASTALAEPKTAAPPGPPAPPPEMSFEQGLVGNWQCEGKQDPVPGMPDGKRLARLECKMTKAGFWLQCDAIATAGPMKDQSVITSFVGWDPVQQKHIRTSFNPGGITTLTSTKGWEGNTLVWAGELTKKGQKLPFKITIVKQSETEQLGKIELDGKQSAEDHCTKIK
jgi:hypothetical protein